MWLERVTIDLWIQLIVPPTKESSSQQGTLNPGSYAVLPAAVALVAMVSVASREVQFQSFFHKYQI